MTSATAIDRLVAASLFGGAALLLVSPLLLLQEHTLTLVVAVTTSVSGVVAASRSRRRGRSRFEETSEKGWNYGCEVATITWLWTALVGGVMIGVANAILDYRLDLLSAETLLGGLIGGIALVLGYGFVVLFPGLIVGSITGHVFYRYVTREERENDKAGAPASR